MFLECQILPCATMCIQQQILDDHNTWQNFIDYRAIEMLQLKYCHVPWQSKIYQSTQLFISTVEIPIIMYLSVNTLLVLYICCWCYIFVVVLLCVLYLPIRYILLEVWTLLLTCNITPCVNASIPFCNGTMQKVLGTSDMHT